MSEESEISVMGVVECKLWVFGGIEEWRCTRSENMRWIMISWLWEWWSVSCGCLEG